MPPPGVPIRFKHARLMHEVHEGHTLATVSGELDIWEFPTLRELLLDLIGQGAGDLIIDMRDVSFLDSSCLGVVVGAMQHLAKCPGARCLRIVSDGSPVGKIFTLTGLVEVIALYKDVASAVRAASTSPGPAG